MKALQEKILSWYKENGRSLPWRKTHDPYTIMLSEMMLQQTQVSRVLDKMPIFLAQFPDIHSIAYASRAELIRAWSGMGYNNRILRFQQLAIIIVNEHKGIFPHTIQELEALPGVGKYTAHAVASFAFLQKVPVVDINVRRVYSRIFWRQKTFEDLVEEKAIWEIAPTLLPTNSYDYNQALMDLGALICTKSRPLCLKCPVSSLCQSASRLVKGKLERRVEPNRRGVPNRIYRGKIVEYLRSCKEYTSALQIAAAVVPEFKDGEKEWLLTLVRALQKDGLVTVEEKQGTLRIKLP